MLTLGEIVATLGTIFIIVALMNLEAIVRLFAPRPPPDPDPPDET